jgi:hypothetical protein
MKIYFQTEFPFRSLSRKNHVFFQTEIPFQGDGIPYFRYDPFADNMRKFIIKPVYIYRLRWNSGSL